MADATADMLFDGAFRNAEVERAFALRQAVNLAQDERLPTLDRKLRDRLRHLPQLLPAFGLDIGRYILRLRIQPIEFAKTIDRYDLRAPRLVHQNRKGGAEEIGTGIGDVLDTGQQCQFCVRLLHDIVDIVAKRGSARQPAPKRGFVRADMACQPLGPIKRNRIHDRQWMMNGA